MSSMLTWLTGLFGIQPYQPHGYCLLWSDALIATHVVADSVIALSYYSIPFALMVFVSRRNDLAFRWIFVMFAVFILACGTTHVLDIWTLWFPDYWIDAVIRAFTAVVSLGTAAALWFLIPHALRLVSPAQLQLANANLQVEVRERERAERDLQRLNRELQQRTSELEQLNRELEAFSYSVSHDLRAPLRAIAGFAGFLDKRHADELSQNGRELLDQVLAGAARMGELIDDMLALSRVSRVGLEPIDIDLASIATGAVRSLELRDPDRAVEVVVQGDLTARGDRRLITILLENLLGNAWKFTRQRPRARIELSETVREGERVFVVRDNGAGFDPGQADRLFSPFQRLHSAEEFEGSGIGLATVQRVVHRHGGRIWAEGEPGRGAAFYFTLSAPLSPDGAGVDEG